MIVRVFVHGRWYLGLVVSWYGHPLGTCCALVWDKAIRDYCVKAVPYYDVKMQRLYRRGADGRRLLRRFE